MPDRMWSLVEDLYPICRSITGDGVRATLDRIERDLPAAAPAERGPDRDAGPRLDRAERVEHPGRLRRPARRHARHRLRRIEPPCRQLQRAGPRADVARRAAPSPPHPPELPDWIPYRTSYYAETWGFCLSQRALDALPEDDYEVSIDSTLAPGHLSYGELVLPGEDPAEVVFSTHVCHPSLADDNLSSIAVATALARDLASRPHRYTYRFVFAPGTIGTIAWLARNREVVPRIRAGLTLTCLGDGSPFTYKRTVGGDGRDRSGRGARPARRRGRPRRDRLLPVRLRRTPVQLAGIRAPVGSLMRGRHGRFPEYHTSADSLEFISAANLAESLATVAGDRRRPRGQPDVHEPRARRRAAARQARALRGDRRHRHPGPQPGDAVGPDAVRRRARPDLDRGSLGDAVGRDPRRGGPAARRRPPDRFRRGSPLD